MKRSVGRGLLTLLLVLGLAACSDRTTDPPAEDGAVPDTGGGKLDLSTDAAQPDAAQPDAAQPDTAQPDAAPPDQGPPDAPVPDKDPCGPGTKPCSGTCANLQVDPNNCGACGNKCKPGQVCMSGKCTLVCQAGLTNCSGTCVNLQTDTFNCGACGATCTAGQLCSAGKCALSCQAGLSNCGGTCVNLQSDLSNCGTCGTKCLAGQICSAGKCVLSCQKGLTDCNGTCVNMSTDLYNCGTCGNKCKAGHICAAGKCVLSCPSGLTDCGGACANLQTDTYNCGVCKNVCKAGHLCAAGKCVLTCSGGLTGCSGACTDVKTDLKNCGKCGNACGAGKVCCAGACVDLLTDLKNCGKCGTKCATGDKCVAGKCTKPASCTDKIKNGDETDVDCGGSCPPCSTGSKCSKSKDCKYGLCTSNKCSYPTTCKTLLAAHPGLSSGAYTIDPDGTGGDAAYSAYCDMTTGGGGWTMILNITATAPKQKTSAKLTDNFLFAYALMKDVAGGSKEVRFNCKQGSKVIDVYTSSSLWFSRPYATGNGCSQGYNWHPNLSLLKKLPTNNFAYTKSYSVSCCCRSGHHLDTYQIGMLHSHWLINDKYYGGWWRHCAGAKNATTPRSTCR